MARPTHRHRPDEIPNLITLDELARRRKAGHSYRRLAEDLDVGYDAIRVYCHQHLDPNLCRQTGWRLRKQPRCKRCTFLPEPANPLLADGFCLYCHIEASGLDLLTYHTLGYQNHVDELIQSQDNTKPPGRPSPGG